MPRLDYSIYVRCHVCGNSIQQVQKMVTNDYGISTCLPCAKEMVAMMNRHVLTDAQERAEPGVARRVAELAEGRREMAAFIEMSFGARLEEAIKLNENDFRGEISKSIDEYATKFGVSREEAIRRYIEFSASMTKTT